MIKSITSVKVSGRRVIVRAGFDVPIQKNSKTGELEVADDARIRDCLPTLRYLIEEKAKIIIFSHLDRPEGWEIDKSLHPVSEKLAELVGPHSKVIFLAEDITKRDCVDLTRTLADGDILFLENLRFYPGEQEGSVDFSNLLAGFGDVYVDEAFSNAHRKDASMVGLAKKLPAYGGIGFLKEIQALNKVLKNPTPPLIVMMGGAKIQGKVETIHSLARLAQYILVGGVIGIAFLKAAGYEIGKSKVADVIVAKELLRNYKQKIVMPIDVVVVKSEDSQPRAVAVDKILPNDSIYDIGPESVRKFARIIKSGQTLVWNGPFGKFEDKRFGFGSRALAQVFAARSKGKAYGVVGGGETIELINQAKVGEFIDHVSIGGGAMLEFLAGKQLPAIKALDS